jgi:predicted dehydrogenase
MGAASGKSARSTRNPGEGVAKTAAGKVRVGVVGVGVFGAHHARHYAGHADAQLVALVDPDLPRACAAAEIYGAVAYADPRALIGKVDAVSITVPASLHHAVAAPLIEAGISTFIEKPVTIDAPSAADLAERAVRAGVIVQVGHIERFSPAFRVLKERARNPRLISAVRQMPWHGRAADVDVVLDLMIHDIDLALVLAGAPVLSVDAVGANVVSTTWDVAEAHLTFANGVVASLSASRVALKPLRMMSVVTPGRCLIADFAGPSLAIVARASATLDGAPGGVASETIALPATDNLGDEIAAFLDSVRTGRRPLVDGTAGLDVMRVADMILQSIARPSAAGPSRQRRAL